VIDEVVDELAAGLRLRARERRRVLDEVRDHFEDAVADRERRGCSPGEAEIEAVRAFGSPRDIARKLNGHAAAHAIRRSPGVLAVCGLGVVVGFLIAASGDVPGLPTKAAPATRISFFVAAVGLQVSLAAGIRTASLAIARWEATAASANDAAITRRAATIGFGGLLTATAGWTIALVSVGDRSAAAGLVGVLVMGAAVIGAGFGLRYRPSQLDDVDLAGEPPAPPFLLGLGERVIDVINAKPAIAAAIVASAAALAAMTHAETSPMAATPWGLLEAGAVVVGLLVLGPPLGLRGRPRH